MSRFIFLLLFAAFFGIVQSENRNEKIFGQFGDYYIHSFGDDRFDNTKVQIIKGDQSCYGTMVNGATAIQFGTTCSFQPNDIADRPWSFQFHPEIIDDGVKTPQLWEYFGPKLNAFIDLKPDVEEIYGFYSSLYGDVEFVPNAYADLGAFDFLYQGKRDYCAFTSRFSGMMITGDLRRNGGTNNYGTFSLDDNTNDVLLTYVSMNYPAPYTNFLPMNNKNKFGGSHQYSCGGNQKNFIKQVTGHPHMIYVQRHGETEGKYGKWTYDKESRTGYVTFADGTQWFLIYYRNSKNVKWVYDKTFNGNFIEVWKELNVIDPYVIVTYAPSDLPSAIPSDSPSQSPTDVPSDSPSKTPSDSPTNNPSESPSSAPTSEPSNAPSDSPTQSPTGAPSQAPTSDPSSNPSDSPTSDPTSNPTALPSVSPTNVPTAEPTASPILANFGYPFGMDSSTAAIIVIVMFVLGCVTSEVIEYYWYTIPERLQRERRRERRYAQRRRRRQRDENGDDDTDDHDDDDNESKKLLKKRGVQPKTKQTRMKRSLFKNGKWKKGEWQTEEEFNKNVKDRVYVRKRIKQKDGTFTTNIVRRLFAAKNDSSTDTDTEAVIVSTVGEREKEAKKGNRRNIYKSKWE